MIARHLVAGCKVGRILKRKLINDAGMYFMLEGIFCNDLYHFTDHYSIGIAVIK